MKTMCLAVVKIYPKGGGDIWIIYSLAPLRGEYITACYSTKV